MKLVVVSIDTLQSAEAIAMAIMIGSSEPCMPVLSLRPEDLVECNVICMLTTACAVAYHVQGFSLQIARLCTYILKMALSNN